MPISSLLRYQAWEILNDNTEGKVKKGLNWWSEFILWTKKMCKLKGTFSILTHPPKIYVPFSVQKSCVFVQIPT